MSAPRAARAARELDWPAVRTWSKGGFEVNLLGGEKTMGNSGGAAESVPRGAPHGGQARPQQRGPVGMPDEDPSENWDGQFPRWVWVLLAAIVFVVGGVVGRSMAVPFSTEFWRIAAQPMAVIIAGLAALSAAALAFRAQRAASLTALSGVTMQVGAGNTQYEATYGADVAQRNAEAHDTAVDRCWERFIWIVALGERPRSSAEEIPFDLVTSMLEGLHDDVVKLNDQTLINGVEQYGNDLFGIYSGLGQ